MHRSGFPFVLKVAPEDGGYSGLKQIGKEGVVVASAYKISLRGPVFLCPGHIFDYYSHHLELAMHGTAFRTLSKAEQPHTISN